MAILCLSGIVIFGIFSVVMTKIEQERKQNRMQEQCNELIKELGEEEAKLYDECEYIDSNK